MDRVPDSRRLGDGSLRDSSSLGAVAPRSFAFRCFQFAPWIDNTSRSHEYSRSSLGGSRWLIGRLLRSGLHSLVLLRPTHLSALDRLALLVYLFCMFWPAFAANDLTTVTPVIAWSIGVGVAALIASFAVHRARRGKESLGA